MSRVLSILIVIALLAVGSALASSPTQPNEGSFVSFMDFMHKYHKNYSSAAEFQHRYEVFKNNLAIIQRLQRTHTLETGESGELVYTVTKFADLTPAEFKKQYLGFVPKTSLAMHDLVPVAKPVRPNNESSVDWRQKGVITAVKDQGQCGSCWAFSTTEEIESTWALAGNTLTELAVQQIVSCDNVDQGCSGGDVPTAYSYVMKAGGLEGAANYPYISGGGDSGVCHFKASEIVAKISGFTYATKPCQDACDNQDEQTLANNLASLAPVSICVDAEPWQFYGQGILRSGCAHDYNDLDHCVQLVGYNTAGTTPYWIVRNSWNTDWGIQGYIYIEMGKNLCGIADEATISSIKSN